MGVRQQHQDSFIQAFQQGEERGFAYFFKALYKPLCFFADKYVDQMDVAEDIVSDSFMRVWEKRTGFTHSKPLKSYLFQSVRNACINYLKSQKRSNFKDIPEAVADKTMQDTIIYAEVMNEIYLTIEALPEKYKFVLEKLFYERKTVREISEEFNVPVSTIKNQKLKALSLIRQKLSSLQFLSLLSVIPLL